MHPFFELLDARHSMRKFTSEHVTQAELALILSSINKAPSAGNLQAYEVFVVCAEKMKTELVQSAWGQGFIREAPVVLVFCANPERSAGKYGQRGSKLYCVQDATIACTYAMLAATALGLASVWIGAFEEKPVKDAVGIPLEWIPVAILPIGHAGKQARMTPRRELGDLIHEV